MAGAVSGFFRPFPLSAGAHGETNPIEATLIRVSKRPKGFSLAFTHAPLRNEPTEGRKRPRVKHESSVCSGNARICYITQGQARGKTGDKTGYFLEDKRWYGKGLWRGCS